MPEPQRHKPDVSATGASPRAPIGHDDYKQEIRIATVMYGGVSLAIYIHGVAQELLRLVRSTSGANVMDDPVAQIYQEMSRQVRSLDPNPACDGERCPTRFVIDILSGTSAGGINAVFLAKAIAIRARNLDKLRETWLDTADMEKLLNTGGIFEPKRSLLRGEWMYQELNQAFRAMNSGDSLDDEDCFTPERLDLFVTTTDLNGVPIPIRLADMEVPEKVHKGSFNFRYDNISLAETPLDIELDTLRRHDFLPDFDAMLAFASRCTSSFPVAFAPMKLADIQNTIGEKEYVERKTKYCEFFRWIPPKPLVLGHRNIDIDQRELADGGYLDNKPFGHAIDAMTFRATKLPHCRKLFFIDPFPEIGEDKDTRTHFDFIQNGLAAATSLPRYQTIRQEIDRINRANATQNRLRALHTLVNDNSGAVKDFSTEKFNAAIEDHAFGETTVENLTAHFGPAYPSYHEVRLLDSTDDLARIVSGLHEAVLSQDLFQAVRYIVRVWRNAIYCPNAEAGKQLENQFFTDFDYAFRIRRAIHLLEWAQKERNSAEVCDSLIRQITRLQRTRERLSIPDSDSANHIWKDIQALGQVLSWEKVTEILEPTADQARVKRAEAVYRQYKELIDALAEAIKKQWGDVFKANRQELRSLFAFPGLKSRYKSFDFEDMISLTFLEGSDVSEHTEVEIHRISPADGIQRPLDRKLGGYALADFGAFLKREWRENDMFWGRMDASERIVSAILSHPDDKEMRERYIDRLRCAIVIQEVGRNRIDFRPAEEWCKQGRLTEYLLEKYQLPTPPEPATSASQIARAADIFGRMLEEDVGVKNKATGLLRTIGRMVLGALALLVPGSLGRVFLHYWLQLILVLSVVAFAAGALFGKPGVRWVGIEGIAAVALATIVAWITGDLLTGKKRGLLTPAIKWIPAIVLTLLVILGCMHLPNEWNRISRHLKTVWSEVSKAAFN